MNLSSIHQEFADKITEVRYVGTKREKLGWQCLPLLELIRNFDVYFILGNPRILSNIFLSLLLVISGKQVVVQGQLHTAGSRRLFQRIRLYWWKKFKYFFLYNDGEAFHLSHTNGFGNKFIIGMNNGLDQDSIDAAASLWTKDKLKQWQAQNEIEGNLLVLSCARLEAKNNFEWMINALPFLIAKYPKLMWCVIGDGLLKTALIQRAEQLGVNKKIRWLGAIYDELELAPWFLSSKVLIHPGAIGLSLLHAFGYGLPVFTHDDANNHMPEFSVLEPGTNGSVFRYADMRSFQDNLSDLLSDPAKLENFSAQARAIAKNKYNTRVMSERFLRMCEQVIGVNTEGNRNPCA
ncbi:glycosyltransferase family 4 protein [Methyloterricola oryzae]|uniref:glycosyltransferase family 4 protein n=1 Tax=Methyloterricola oryzae TaxID=1495050 RepID=UPI0013013B5C|nr:glycosyltransferase family 4 protein [Methyloterricola oryzae]